MVYLSVIITIDRSTQRLFNSYEGPCENGVNNLCDRLTELACQMACKTRYKYKELQKPVQMGK